MKRCLLKGVLPGLLVGCLFGMSGRAADDVWSRTAGGTFNWNELANWQSGAGFPDGAGQAAHITNDFSGTPTIQLRQAITVGALWIGDAVAAGGNFGPIIKNASGETFRLTFASGVPDVPARIVTGSSGTQTIRLEAPLSLGSPLLADLGGFDANNRPNLTFAALTELNGHRLVFTNGVLGQGQVTFATGGDFTGGGEVMNHSSSTINVDGKKSYAGRVVASSRATGSNAGTFTGTTGGFTNAEIVVNGYLTNGISQVGGQFQYGNRSGFTVNPGQRWTMRQVTLHGGSVNETGQSASNNGGNPTNDWQRGLEPVYSQVATVAVRSAYCYIGISADTATTAGTVVEAGALTRGPGATLYLNGPDGATKRFRAGNAPAFLKGAGGASGTQTQSVIPWIGAFISGNSANPQGFSTCDANGEFRSLADADYANNLTSGAGSNVSVSSLALTQSATVNALRLGYVGTPNIGAGRVLTVASGAVLFQQGARSVGTSGDAAAGTLDFGAAEGVVWVLGQNVNTIGAVITGSGGLTKTGTGELVLTGANTYGGASHVSGGALRVGDGAVSGRLGTGDVTVHTGASLRLSNGGALADGATLSVLRQGLFTGRVALDAGVAESVRYLFLGGQPMAAGTYGSGASAAANKSDTFFSGTGVLTVTGDARQLGCGTVVRIL